MYEPKYSKSFMAMSTFVLLSGFFLLFVGVYNANWPLMEKGYYIAVVLLIAIGVTLIQKSVRDKQEDVRAMRKFGAGKEIE